MITNETRVNPGDRITAYGQTFTVDRILYQDYFGPREAVHPASDFWGYDVEFTDNAGNYHHWKQNQDGGTITRKPS